MDALYSIFQSTLSPEPNTRVRAELDLRGVEGQVGMLPGVLQIIASEQADGGVRQAAAIYFKNRLRKSWEEPANNAASSSSKGPPTVPQEDRAAIKSLLLPTLVATTAQVQTHVASAFHTLVRADFPSQWPDLMDNVGRLVKSQTPKEVYGGIRALLEIVRAFRWIDDANLMEPIVASTFPTILSTGTSLLQSPEVDTQDVGALIYIILKVYKSSINNQLTAHHQSNESIIPWGKFLLEVAQRPVSPSCLPSDEDDRETTPWYKAKKWACFSLNKLFSRYGNPSQLPSTLKSYTPFAERFVATFAPEILSAYLRLTEASIRGDVWLSKKQTHFILRYYEECVKPKSTWSLLKPHVDSLVQQFVFPKLCTTQADEELWELDPVEFVRFNIDPIDIGGPETSAASFLQVVAAKRTKTAFIPQLEFVTSIVQAYPASRSAAEKAGALLMCKAMDLTMLHHSKVSTSLEGFFTSYVVPELTSSDRVLRFRACQLISAFGSKMAWRDSKNLQAAFMGVMQCVTDSELPVRVEAAAASTVLSEHDEIHAAMAPNAPRLMQELLKLSDELELDLLTEAKSKVVERFHEELMPFSVELVEQMKNSYVRLVDAYMASADVDDDGVHEFNLSDGEGDRLFAAMSALQTIYSVLSSCDEKPEILAQLEGSVLPLVAFTIEKEAIELYDDCFDLLDVLTFYQKKVSNGMWHIFELMAKSFLSGAGIDYLAEMLSTFDNLVSYGTDVFKQNAEYRKLLLAIYEKAMKSDQLGLGDHLSACRLADVVLLLLKGSIDEHVPMIVSTVLPILLDESKSQAVTATLRKWATIVVLDALVYDAALTLRCIESCGAGAMHQFFTLALGQVVPKLGKVHEKKVAALAIMSVLGLEDGQVPPAVKAGEAQLLNALLDDLAGIPEAIKRQRILEDAFVDDDDEEGDEEDDEADISSQVVNEGDDDADVHDEDNEYLELLAREGAKLRGKAAAAAANTSSGSLGLGDEYADASYDEDDDEEEAEDDDDEGVVYESPLDEVPVFDHFRQLMTHLQNTRPALLGSLSGRVTEVGSIQDERVRRDEGEA